MLYRLKEIPDSFLPLPSENSDEILSEKLRRKISVSPAELVESAISVISRWYFGSLENLNDWQDAQDNTLSRDNLEGAIRNFAQAFGATEAELSESVLSDQDLLESLLHIQWQITHYHSVLIAYLNGNFAPLNLIAQLEAHIWHRRAVHIQEINARDGKFHLHA